MKKIDFSNVSFDNVDIRGMDFTELKGVKINPQTVYDQNLSRCKFSGVEFIGPFDGVHLYETNFTGSKGAKVDLQTVYYDDLSICNLTDAEVMNTEIQNLIEVLEKTKDGEYITLPNPDILFVKDIIKFGKSDRVPYRKFAIPEKLLKKINFSNVSFANVDIRGLNFIRYKGVKINPQTVFGKDPSGCIFSGVEFIGPFDGATLLHADFTGSKGAIVDWQTVYYDDLAILTDVEIINYESKLSPAPGFALMELTRNKPKL